MSKSTTDPKRPRPGTDSNPASGRKRSTSGTSSSRTIVPYDGDESFLARRHGAHQEDLGAAEGAVRRRAQEGRARRVADSQFDHRPRARLHRPENEIIVGLQTEAPLRASHHAQRRPPHGRHGAEDLRVRAGPACRRDLHEVSQDAQRGRLRRLHAGRAGVPQFARPHRAAGRLRPRADHRRLPTRAALRRGPADRPQGGGEAVARRADVHRGDHPRPRGTQRTDPRAERAAADGRELRVRHLRPGQHGARGGPVAVLRLPGGRQGAERRRDVAGPHLDVPRQSTSSATWRRASSPSSRPRRSSTTSSSSSASSASSARRSTTICSRATRPG